LKNSGRGYFGPEGDEQAVGPTADADVEQLSGKETDRRGRRMTAQWRMRERMQFLNPTSKLAAKQSIIHNHKDREKTRCLVRVSLLTEGRGGEGEDKTRIGYLQSDGMKMSVILLIRRIMQREAKRSRICHSVLSRRE
jgi:hypothetical protein